ncbi:MAG: RNA-binding protein [Solobacterium sp.]|nr:RNA-binding protein [Solobacterium sp.]MBQ1320597.1 RNA-binding protein [Solobacterium sp.]MBQ1356102.1 RNA-binding protein [Solobacterium sp.]
MTDHAETEAVLIRLHDLQEQSMRWQKQTESFFLNEEELAAAQKVFFPSETVRYDGGYPEARKKKVIFSLEGEDDFSDIVCLMAEIDNRFRPIGHRDVLGALMHLQIDRHSFGDFWVDDSHIYLYTNATMGRFLCQELNRIGSHSVSFSVIDEHPVQVFRTRTFEKVISSVRADAVVAALAECSRADAKDLIRRGLVQLNHVTLADADEVCNNNCTISIRGSGRFVLKEVLRKTKKDRCVVEFEQFI